MELGPLMETIFHVVCSNSPKEAWDGQFHFYISLVNWLLFLKNLQCRVTVTHLLPRIHKFSVFDSSFIHTAPLLLFCCCWWRSPFSKMSEYPSVSGWTPMTFFVACLCVCSVEKWSPYWFPPSTPTVKPKDGGSLCSSPGSAEAGVSGWIHVPAHCGASSQLGPSFRWVHW